MSNLQIMVVEDEGIAAKHIVQALESMGYSVPATTAFGEEAVQKAGEILPDLVLMDIILKGKMDGVEAAEQIRLNFDIPVVYLTASSDNSTFARAQLTESFGYILKPFQEESLRPAIEMALYKHQMEAEGRLHAQQLEALYAVSRILAQPCTFQEKSEGVLDALTQISSADIAVMRIPNADGLGMQLVLSVGPMAGPMGWERPPSLPTDGSISRQAFNSREPVVVNDLAQHQSAEPTAVSQGIQSLVSLPINAKRYTLGVVNIASRKPNQFPPNLVRLLSGIVDGLGTL